MACFSKQDIGACGCACALQVRVKGCGATPKAVGSGVTVNLKVGGTTVYTGTTNSSGIAAISGAAGTYDVEVVDGRASSRWATETFSGQSLSCGGTTDVTLSTINSGFHCSEFCGDPLDDTLYATDPNGTWTLTYAATGLGGSGSAGWYGCATKTSMTSVVTSLSAGTCIATTGTANTNYLIQVPASGSTLVNHYGQYLAPPQITTSTPTCSGSALNFAAGIPVGCTGSLGYASASFAATVACPPSLSLTATMPSFGTNLTANPGAGSITITE